MRQHVCINDVHANSSVGKECFVPTERFFQLDLIEIYLRGIIDHADF